MKITKHEINGNDAVTIENANGLTVTLCALGAGIVNIKLPDKFGVPRELVKPHKNGYGGGHNGLTTGRTAGRIENATFTIDGKIAVLEKNNHGVDNLHGGSNALHKKSFSMAVIEQADRAVVAFTYSSPDGEGGYFGDIVLTVSYIVYDDIDRMEIVYGATSDVKTLLNVTNHVYLNASGDLRDKVTEQVMFVNASQVGKLNERSITREVVPVTKPFDFRTPHKIGDCINDESVQLYAGGYDHPFFLDSRVLDDIACSLYSEKSGIKIAVSTTYPCAVIYTDNADCNGSVCFECQYHPDGIHACPDDCGILSPDKPYNNVMRYDFSVDKIS